jgi:hypothetical protein
MQQESETHRPLGGSFVHLQIAFGDHHTAANNSCLAGMGKLNAHFSLAAALAAGDAEIVIDSVWCARVEAYNSHRQSGRRGIGSMFR